MDILCYQVRSVVPSPQPGRPGTWSAPTRHLVLAAYKQDAAKLYALLRRGRSWPKDWRISHPLPAPGATRWGLVLLSLYQLTGGTKATFSQREAREAMKAAEDVQRARRRRRRADARELHASRQPTPRSPLLRHRPDQ
ncbi:hypothetical protein [Streptomyces sp. SR-10]|uniref:hypothetical protein n=1 Tax=Streptomyces sp. SR-10 TaxID=3416442 RepID=UPI003CFAD5C3